MDGRPINIAAWRASRITDVAGEIAQVLAALGGSAHVRQITDVFLARRRTEGRDMPADAQDLVLFTLRDHETGVSGAEVLFHRPFGPDSNRWTLAGPDQRRPESDEAPRLPLRTWAARTPA